MFLLLLYFFAVCYILYSIFESVSIKKSDDIFNVLFIDLKTNGENPFYNQIDSLEINQIFLCNKDNISENNKEDYDKLEEIDNLEENGDVLEENEDVLEKIDKEIKEIDDEIEEKIDDFDHEIEEKIDEIDQFDDEIEKIDKELELKDNEYLKLEYKNNYLNIDNNNTILKEYIESNIPFDGNLYIVSFGNDILFIKELLSKLSIEYDKIIFIDNQVLSMKTIKPYNKECNSWWGSENTDSLYSLNNLLTYLKIEDREENTKENKILQQILFNKLCEINEILPNNITQIKKILSFD